MKQDNLSKSSAKSHKWGTGEVHLWVKCFWSCRRRNSLQWHFNRVFVQIDVEHNMVIHDGAQHGESWFGTHCFRIRTDTKDLQWRSGLILGLGYRLPHDDSWLQWMTTLSTRSTCIRNARSCLTRGWTFRKTSQTNGTHFGKYRMHMKRMRALNAY